MSSYPTYAHEFWIAPRDYRPGLSDVVAADLKVGQMLSGDEFPFLSHRFNRFSVTTRDGVYDIKGNEGDSPAVAYAHETPGLHIIAYQSKPDKITFDAFAEFVEYLTYEGLASIADTHRDRGLPDTGFAESYTRYAKALVQIGPVKENDTDQWLGLPLELLIARNPYSTRDGKLEVYLKRDGQFVEDAQVSIFRRDGSGEVARSITQTDANGRAIVPANLGGEYLLNAVVMEPAEDGGDVVWESHWASLTFRID